MRESGCLERLGVDGAVGLVGRLRGGMGRMGRWRMRNVRVRRQGGLVGLKVRHECGMRWRHVRMRKVYRRIGLRMVRVGGQNGMRRQRGRLLLLLLLRLRLWRGRGGELGHRGQVGQRDGWDGRHRGRGWRREGWDGGIVRG